MLPIESDYYETRQEKVKSILRGNFHEKTLRNLQPHKKLILFVSSTFTDTYKERNILQEQILPELQKLGSEQEVQVLFYDMRFGVKDESTLDHSTWQCCQDAIRECREESDGLFFMSLQGNKYGYRPLPKLIDGEFLEKALEQHSGKAELLDLCRRWYRLNENHLLSKFELQSLQPGDGEEYWKVVLPRLRDELLDEVPFDAKLPNLFIGRSVTEWEVLFAEGIKRGSLVGIWVKKEKEIDRQSVDNSLPEQKMRDFNDGLTDEKVEARISRLKEYMSDCFDTIHPLPLQKLFVSDYVRDNDVGRDYLQKWEITVKNRLKEELEKCGEDNTSWKNMSTQEFGLPVEYLEEMLHHCKIAHQKASSFIGRDDLVEEALTLINAAFRMKRSSSVYAAITAAVIGQSGAGKTALMSKVATVVRSRLSEDGDPPIITRYCGTSTFSLHGKDLIHSISLQLLAIYGEKEKIHETLQAMTNQKYEEAVEYFSALLQRYPVILFIDSVDQLSNKDEARSKLSFLKGLQIHEKSKIIISTLPDEYDETKKQWKYRYLCEKVVRDHQIPVVEMKHHTANEATTRSLLERLLERRERKITADQWSVVLRSASEEPTMLYLNLSLEVITKWRSWEREVELRPTVKGLINQIFEGLERHYGRLLVSYALGFITFSREGISDQEMIDCLSRQSEVFQEVCQYWQGVKTIPLHVWLRVKQAIKALLAEKDHTCLKWYHRQLWEAAQERYEEVRKDCHSIMGRYFSEQPLCLTELDVWHPDSKINSRRVKEGYYHLYESGLYEEAIEEMCSLEMVCASALCDDAYYSLRYLSKLRSQAELKCNQRLDHYYRWIRRAITFFAIDPRKRIPCSASEEPSISMIKAEMVERSRRVNYRKEGECSNMKVVQTLGGSKVFGSLEATLIGHRGVVSSLSWNQDGSKIASGSYDKTIKIWDSSTGELLNTLEGHSDGVYSVSWNQDGSKIASGSNDKTIKIWDSSTGELLNTLEGHSDGVYSVSWNQDGSKIASGSRDKTIKIWDSSTGELLNTLEGHSDSLHSVSWNQDGSKIASGSYDKTIKIWDSSTGELLNTLEGHSGSVYSVSWNQDGSKIASGSRDNTIKIWDSSTGELLNTLEGHSNVVSSVSWNQDGSKIASGAADKTIKIWDSSTGELLNTLEGHSDVVTSVSWNQDGSKIASGASDKTIKIWDSSTGELLNTLEGHSGSVTSVSWNQDGSKIASGSYDKTIKIWDSSTGELLNTLEGHSGEVTSVSWNQDGSKIASGSYDKTIKIWDSSTGELLNTLEGHSDILTSVSWNQDGSKIASGSDDKTIKIWDSSTGKLLNTLEGHSGVVTSVSWNQDGSKIASGSDDKTIKIWDSSTGELLNTLEGHSDVVTSVSWNQDGSKIVSGSDDKTIKIWDSSTGELLNTLEGHSDNVTSVSWNQDGSKIASGSWNNTIKIWDSSTGELLNTLEGHSDNVTSVSWNQDGSKIASGSWNNTIKIWDSSTGELLNTLEGHSGQLWSISWNQDGSKIASGSWDQTIKIWDSSTGKLLNTLEGHSDIVTSVSWKKDGSKIASVSRDRTIKIWDSSTGELLNTLEGHSDVVTSVSWKKDGSKIASGSYDKTIKIWDSSTGELLNTMEGHSDIVTSVSWNQDGSKIASGSWDKTIKIWDSSTGKLLNTLEGHGALVASVAWNQDGSKIASGAADKTIKIWDSSTEELLNILNSDEVNSISWNQDGSKIASGSWDKTIKIWDSSTGKLLNTLEGHSDIVTSVSWNQDGSKIASGSRDKTIKIWDL